MSYFDWAILIFALTGIVTYGIIKSRGERNKESFLKGNAEARWWAVCLGVMATQASGVTFLSTPGQGYSDGLRFVQFYFGLPIAMLIICLTFIPAFFKAGVYTAYEFLEKRFDLKTRLLTSLLFLIQRGLAAGITLYLPCIILSTLFGWNFKLVILFTGITVILYTVSGGAKAVSKTQTLQMAVMLGGLLFIFCMVLIRLQGISMDQALHIAGWSGKMNAVNFHFDLKDRYNFWSGIIGGTFVALAYFGTDQSQVQRYIGGQSITQSRLGLITNGLVKIPMQIFILLTGVMVFVFYQTQSSPLFFNPQVENKILTSSYAGAYQEKQSELRSLETEKKTVHQQLMAEGPSQDALKTQLKDLLKQEGTIRTEAKAIIKQALPDIETNDRDYVFLHFVLHQLPIGLIGLLLAVVLSATMSSTSAEITALASTTCIDWAYRLNKKQILEDHSIVLLTRLFTIGWGFIAIGFALYVTLVENLIQFVNLIGSLFYGTILGVFLCAFYIRYTIGHAVFAAAIISELVVLTLYKTTDIGFLWFNLIGCGLVTSLAVILTPILRSKTKLDKI